ncbi:hypothetical protein APICC_03336 [Apis cerana cerana]|uniref:Uncharacterized protein n=1 Tax=Apis cerana cerana TaxID=94128 RepID=A0A2A3EDE2_APICC|nr:hypothetical protein APICC_03336 [Apis cerana cerana]
MSISACQIQTLDDVPHASSRYVLLGFTINVTMIDALRDKDSQPMTFQRHESRYQSKEASTRKHKDQETE